MIAFVTTTDTKVGVAERCGGAGQEFRLAQTRGQVGGGSGPLPRKQAVARRLFVANFFAYPPVRLVGMCEVVLGLLGALDRLHHPFPHDLEAALQVWDVVDVLAGPAEG